MLKKLIALIVICASLYSVVLIASAHVVVRPDEVGVAAFQTFVVGVPSERDLSTIEVRLLLPDGLEFVTPTVKSGWKVDVKKHTLPDGDHPYEIAWSAGSVPGHFRDEFSFSARVPATPTSLGWKAYQKYSDGSVVSWDLDSSATQPTKEDGSPDFSKVGPQSETAVIDDLTKDTSSQGDRAFSIGALIVALASFVVAMRRRKM